MITSADVQLIKR